MQLLSKKSAENVTVCICPNCVPIPMEGGKAVSFHKVLMLHGQGDTNNWDRVKKMAGERILRDPMWQIPASGGLFAFAIDDEIHPGF